MVIGIDIGGTHFRIGEIENGEVINCQKIKTIEVLKSCDVLKDLCIFLEKYMDGKSVEGISIGFPGILDRDRKKVIQLPNLPALDNMEIVDELQKVLNVPIYIERDANMCLYYDINKYKLTDKECVIGIYFGTGIGSSIFFNGKPYGGYNGVAGEIGHIPVDGVKTHCGCGNVGCMEEVAGGKYLARIAKNELNVDISDVFSKFNDHKLIKQFIDRMSIAIATYVNILNPDYILIGGGLIAMKDFPIEELKQRVSFHTRKPEPMNSLNMLIVDDEKDKGIIGAYYYALAKSTFK